MFAACHRQAPCHAALHARRCPIPQPNRPPACLHLQRPRCPAPSRQPQLMAVPAASCCACEHACDQVCSHSPPATMPYEREHGSSGESLCQPSLSQVLPRGSPGPCIDPPLERSHHSSPLCLPTRNSCHACAMPVPGLKFMQHVWQPLSSGLFLPRSASVAPRLLQPAASVIPVR